MHLKNMTKFLSLTCLALLFASALNAQKMNFNTDDYKKQWSEITALEEKGLPKSALEKVEALRTRAVADNNPSQIIKTLIFRSKYVSELEEDGFVLALNRLRGEADSAAFPVKNILQSMLGEMYAGYLANNVWRFRNRTATVNFKNDDIRTWSVEQLNDEAALHFRLSLNDDRAKNVPILNFNALTTEGANTDDLRPTLFDFLAHRAIDFFSDDKSYLTKPAYKFELDNDALFANSEQFVGLNLESRDSTSGKLWALRLLQEVIRFHQNDAAIEALVDADLKRLQFVHDHSTSDLKQDLYLAALQNLSKKHANSPVFAEIALKIAQFHHEQGASFNPNDPTKKNKWANKTALDIAQNAVKKFPKAYGSIGLKGLITDILTPSNEVKTEEVNVPNKHILASATFRNVDSVYFKVIRLYEKVNRRDFSDDAERLKYYNQLPFVSRKSAKLPNDGDYNSHTTELRIDKLPLGVYLILSSDNPRFSNKNGGKVSYLTMNVSNIAYFHRTGATEPNEFVVVNRATGEPLSSVTVEFWENHYNSKTRRDERLKIGNAISDRDGFVFPRLPREKYYTLRFIYGKDTLATGDNYANYFYKPEKRTQQWTHFFLDRAIYRPSQTVFFKGILIEKAENTEGGGSTENAPRIVPNEAVDLTFFDANHQKITSISLKTNAFGTFNGSFVAPTAGLLGRMTIESNKGGFAAFRVEEYKRPKFEVTMKPLEGTFVLNQDIKVKGNAKAFAGSNVDGATVKYRVVRETRFPYWRWWFPPFDTEGSQEIAHGETTTDAKGEFTVDFKALPNRRVAKDSKPVFDYSIYADVTDLNGETHSAKGSVSIGYTSLLTTIDVADEINRRDLQSIKIRTTNLNNQPLATKGAVKIDLLTSPRRPYIERYWARPDTQTIAEDFFRRDFPLYAYRNEDKEQNWIIKRTVLEREFSTPDLPNVSAGIDTNFLKISELQRWQAGAYRMTVTTTDPTTGEKIETIKHFLLYDLADDVVPCNKTFFAWLDKTQYEPTETATLTFGTAAEQLNVLIEEELDGKILKKKWLPLAAVSRYAVKLTEASRGNHFIHLSFALDNRATLTTQTIVVPFTNKALSIEYQTFRDKLAPGSDEEWRLKISGDKKEKVAAELVAAMYDASLDQFAANHWSLDLYPSRFAKRNFDAPTFGEAYSNPFYLYNTEGSANEDAPRNYRSLNWFGFEFAEGGRGGGIMVRGSRAEGRVMMDAAPQMANEPKAYAPMRAAKGNESAKINYVPPVVTNEKEAKAKVETEKPKEDFSQVKARTNLNETVFFFPEMQTDAEGNIVLKFKMNEALTRWKFLALAHTTDLKVGLSEKTVVTQKDLMVFPNAPRFLREGDDFTFSAKISNLTTELLRGSARLELFDALTMQPIDVALENTQTDVNFETKAGESAPLSWHLKIPFGKFSVVTWRVVAKAGSFSDGEESTLPVLTNRMLVTETLPLSVRGGATKAFTFESLKNSGKSKTLTNNSLTLEFTSNPAWYAVQALPYLMEYPYECTEQIFSRFYANSLATSVANAHPKIKAVFDRWRTLDVAALQSNLSKNQELKTALLEETPWVMAAQSEEMQKKNIGLLFDLNKMANEQAVALQKMHDRQLDNGGFAWFSGGRDNWFITQYITEGLAHLRALGVSKFDTKTQAMLDKSIDYCDARAVEAFDELEKEAKRGAIKLEDYVPSSFIVHYLYTRSFFDKDIPQRARVFDFYVKQAEKSWTKQAIYEQGLIALASKRLKKTGKSDVTDAIVKSLTERAVRNEELGMYFKTEHGYHWNEMPVETQALMIELFGEVGDAASVDELKIWLLKNKQTNAWKTTKATASAVYALLKSGDNWLDDDQIVNVSVGGTTLNVTNLKQEAGTGYFKTTFPKEDIAAKMGDIKVSNPNKVVAWGAMYWQYFEDLDKIKDFRETPLTIKKQLFVAKNGDKGIEMSPITEGSKVLVGNKIKVRIELRVDRDMEFVHMKDARAAGFEPTNVLSQYKWQGGLGYYESTRDAATHFFFDYLPKGTYVFEYDLVVNHKGDMSNGITTIQSMYAPEFSSHTEGVRVKVD